MVTTLKNTHKMLKRLIDLYEIFANSFSRGYCLVRKHILLNISTYMYVYIYEYLCD